MTNCLPTTCPTLRTLCLGCLIGWYSHIAHGADRPPAPPLAERICPLVITPEQVRPHVEYLASPEHGGRDGEGATLASEYVAKTLREAGLQPLFGGEYFQSIPDSVQPDGTQPEIGRNVGAIWPGSDPLLKDEVILLAAHYDHLGLRKSRRAMRSRLLQLFQMS